MKQIKKIKILTTLILTIFSLFIFSSCKSQNTEIKTMNMTFERYEEGDYPHLIFKDLAKNGEEYDFRFLDDNNLSGIPILIEDKESSFGFKANPKYLNKTFIVSARQKLVSDNDLDGKLIKTKAWIIVSIKSK